jgi:hypothetical protein
MMTEAELASALDGHASAAFLNGETEFLVRPDSWFDAGKWRCLNDHVRTDVKIGGAAYEGEWRYDVCHECGTPVRLTFPTDTSGPIKQPKGFM